MRVKVGVRVKVRARARVRMRARAVVECGLKVVSMRIPAKFR